MEHPKYKLEGLKGCLKFHAKQQLPQPYHPKTTGTSKPKFKFKLLSPNLIANVHILILKFNLKFSKHNKFLCAQSSHLKLGSF